MNEKKQKDYCFVKEKTKKVPVSRKRLGSKVGLAACCGAAFAAVCFCVSMMDPAVESKVIRENADVSLGSHAREQSEEGQQPVIRESMSREEYEALEEHLAAIGANAEKSIVDVQCVTKDNGWFERETDAGEGSGIIIGDNDSEILILTEESLISDVRKIRVTFDGDETASARIKACDGSTGLAVISADKKDISDKTAREIRQTAVSSVPAQAGDPVAAVGSPDGTAGSVLTGQILSADQTVSFSDGNYRILTTDLVAPSTGSGVLLNTNGEIVGVITHRYGPSEAESEIAAVSAQDLSDLIRDLIRGKDIPYLGIHVSQITADVAASYELPQGLYIQSVDWESPAMLAGLQAGDVLVQINGISVETQEDLTGFLKEAYVNQQIRITVERLGSSGSYQKIVCAAVLDNIE